MSSFLDEGLIIDVGELRVKVHHSLGFVFLLSFRVLHEHQIEVLYLYLVTEALEVVDLLTAPWVCRCGDFLEDGRDLA